HTEPPDQNLDQKLAKRHWVLSGLCVVRESARSWELTADRFEVRGSDGGEADCGGATWFFSRLVSAISYRAPKLGESAGARPHARGSLVRAAISLK
ncbi:hypothetical protein, partial [Catenulispora subtropica]|uniref:hypothetical protein n=1 Tax=Catenulispora subtropica TaxID=450798 RepID=UPI003CD07B52